MAKHITAKQLAFVKLYIKEPTSVGAGKAYQKAYSSGNSFETAMRAGKRLLNNPKVQSYIKQVRSKAMSKVGISLADHLEELKDIREGAKDAGQWSAATSAEMARGKVSGLYVEKKEVEQDIRITWGEEKMDAGDAETIADVVADEE